MTQPSFCLEFTISLKNRSFLNFNGYRSGIMCPNIHSGLGVSSQWLMWRKRPCATCNSQFARCLKSSTASSIQEGMPKMPQPSVSATCQSTSRFASARGKGLNPMLGGSTGVVLKASASEILSPCTCVCVCACVFFCECF